MYEFIYARVGLTLNIYHACMFRCYWEWNIGASLVEKLNGDLLQPSRIRYTFYPLVLALFISIAYGNGLIYGVIQYVLVYPKPWEVFSVTTIFHEIYSHECFNVISMCSHVLCFGITPFIFYVSPFSYIMKKLCYPLFICHEKLCNSIFIFK